MRTECPKCKVDFSTYGKCPYCGRQLVEPKNRLLPILLCTVGTLAVIVLAGVALYAYSSGNIIKSAWFKFSSGTGYEVSVQPPSSRLRGTSKPTITSEERKNLRDLFEKRQFDPLNKAASEIQCAFEYDPSLEYRVCDFYEIFGSSLPEYEELLNAWVAHSPSHFAPYLARSQYYYYRGWESRGYKYVSETSEEQFSGMRSFFQKALKDADAALAIIPRLLSAHLIRLNIYNADGTDNQENAAFEAARQHFPGSFLLYNAMITAKLPRWGGSYAEMEKIAMQAYEHIRTNPEIYMLFGRIYEDQASVCMDNKQHDKAMALFTKAIRYGEYYEFFEDRARLQLAMQKYDQALKDASHSISLRPAKPRPYSLRATVYLNLGDLEAAEREIRSMDAEFPGNYEISRWKDWAARWLLNQGHTVFKGNLEDAVAWYGMAIETKPECQEAYYWRGVACFKLNNSSLAYTDFEQAIRLNPHDLKSYRMMDSLLASQRRWDEIIEYWNRFLSLEPDNGVAYLERAGVNRHKGDMQSALADLKIACDLGNKKACEIQGRNR